MASQSVIAIFDIGKTNKKLLLFDEYYQLVFEAAKNKKIDIALDMIRESAEAKGVLHERAYVFLSSALSLTPLQ